MISQKKAAVYVQARSSVMAWGTKVEMPSVMDYSFFTGLW